MKSDYRAEGNLGFGDPIFVGNIVDGILALILWAMMSGCNCPYCSSHRLFWFGP